MTPATKFRNRDDADGEARRRSADLQARQMRSNLLSWAMSTFEVRHSKMFSYHEQEAARKAYCLGVVDGYVERDEELIDLGKMYDQIKAAEQFAALDTAITDAAQKMIDI